MLVCCRRPAVLRRTRFGCRWRSCSGDLPWIRVPYRNWGGGGGGDQPQVLIRNFLRPHDVRRDGEDDLVFLLLLVFLCEEVFQNGNLRQQGIATEGLCLSVVENSAHQVDFSVSQPRFEIDTALSDGRLIDAAYVLRSGDGRNLEGHFQGDFAIRMDVRRDVDVHPDINVLKLSVHQRPETLGSSRGSERTGCYGNAIANL